MSQTERISIGVIGAGHIGQTISILLSQSGQYHVHLADQFATCPINHKVVQTYSQIDASKQDDISSWAESNQLKGIVCALPFFMNLAVAKVCAALKIAYFDLTEDVAVTNEVKALAKSNPAPMVPQCGLAPGAVGIIANGLAQSLDSVDQMILRVGALPQFTNTQLGYAFTWSTDGLINEYLNLCDSISDGTRTKVTALSDREQIRLDGVIYEAFNTSGGLGSLVDKYEGKVHELNYKTLRYPGHRERMLFLLKELRLSQDRALLKQILENALPITNDDVVVLYVKVMGRSGEQLVERSYFNKIYPTMIDGFHLDAIQLTTASGICAMVDLIMKRPEKYSGFVMQENIPLEAFFENQFGQYYKRTSQETVHVECDRQLA